MYYYFIELIDRPNGRIYGWNANKELCQLNLADVEIFGFNQMNFKTEKRCPPKAVVYVNGGIELKNHYPDAAAAWNDAKTGLKIGNFGPYKKGCDEESKYRTFAKKITAGGFDFYLYNQESIGITATGTTGPRTNYWVYYQPTA